MRTSMTIVASLLACSVSFGGETVRLDAARQTRAGILTRPVLERSFGDQVRVLGEVVRAPGTTLAVKSPLGGRVSRLRVAPGEQVRVGQELLELHSHDLHVLEGAMLSAREAHAISLARYEAGRELLEIEGISRMEIERRRQAMLDAKIRLEQARMELRDVGMSEDDISELIERGHSRGEYVLRALGEGVVMELSAHEQEWIQAFDPVMTIGDRRRVELEVQVPPAQAVKVRRGDTIEFAPVGRPEAAALASVLTPVPRVDPETRMVRVRAKIGEHASALYPGLFVQGNLTHGEARLAPSVPGSALTRLRGADYVFVRLDGERFEARPVRVGLFNGSRYEIQEGVALGDEVVVEGVFLLKSALLSEGGEES